MNTRLQALAQRVDGLGETITMAKDPVDGSTIAVLDWEAVERLLDKLSTLADAATDAPEQGQQPSNAAEFAALWNSRTTAQRDKLVDVLLSQQMTAHACFMEDHKGLKEQLTRTQQALQGSEASRLAGEQKLASIQQALVDFGVKQGVIQPPNAWITEQTHVDCFDCEAAVEDAITHAKATGSTEATYTHTTPEQRGDGFFERQHVGTARRA